MRILHVVPSFYPATAYGGPLESVFQLCAHLAADGHVVRVLTTNADGPDRVLDVPSGYEVVLAPRLSVRYCRRVGRHTAAPSLLALLGRHVAWADVVHLTGVYSFPTIPTLLASRLRHKPLMWSPRGSLQRWQGTRRRQAKLAWELACRAVLPTRYRFHVTSTQEAAATSQRMPHTEIDVIPNGVDLPEHVEHVPDSGWLNLVYLGRLDPIKGLENLLRACALLDDAALPRQWRLTIGGSGTDSYEQSLRRLSRELRLESRVVFSGHVDRRARSEFFANADILVLPSFSENFGLVVAEALAHSVPVVVSRGAPWSAVDEVGCGCWVDNAPASLAQAVTQLANAPLCQMGEAGRAWIQREYSWSAVSRRMTDAYASMLATAPANAA